MLPAEEMKVEEETTSQSMAPPKMMTKGASEAPSASKDFEETNKMMQKS